jgi:hypothetical protein
MQYQRRLIVRMNIFSGFPDPVWELTGRQAEEWIERQSSLRDVTMAKPPGVLRGLGYRGFEVRSIEDGDASPLHLHGGVLDSVDFGPNVVDGRRELERWLLHTAPKTIPGDLIEEAQRDLELRPEDFDLETFHNINAVTDEGCPPNGGGIAPPYNPGPWNTPSVQPRNNCYNYANDRITNTFAQPGRGTGAPISPPPTCANVTPAAQRDGLRSVPNVAASIPNRWYVALVIWPGRDYHWYRQDSGGCWSHKPGGTPARDYDQAGRKISDPATCARGNYTIFCGYMTTDRAVTIA